LLDAASLDALESPLREAPEFPCEKPDGRKDLPELDRQAWVVAYMRRSQPHIVCYATPNAAKRGFKAQSQAKKEGLLAGVFDLTFCWDVKHAEDGRPTICFAEMKGYDASGRVGKLSQEQIDWGNKMHRNGHAVACFFSAQSVIRWLAELGAPLRGKIPA
jgi:hypothetical protein